MFTSTEAASSPGMRADVVVLGRGARATRDEQVDDIVRRRGRIDVVVNNAGGAPYADFAPPVRASTRRSMT